MDQKEFDVWAQEIGVDIVAKIGNMFSSVKNLSITFGYVDYYWGTRREKKPESGKQHDLQNEAPKHRVEHYKTFVSSINQQHDLLCDLDLTVGNRQPNVKKSFFYPSQWNYVSHVSFLIQRRWKLT